ncbi:Transcription elongation regulator 1 [Eumeta japonica]|uniref:Transcription elongation regulator 1 n=1 Tax=Eumeta variegata TaxID=151549 RepID=A0A4C1UL33_EUMVA|nr:Transcription elongation regulator 1 [Eumeta japonica]
MAKIRKLGYMLLPHPAYSPDLTRCTYFLFANLSSFNDFAAKYGKEERFKAIEKVRDRESYFNEYLAEVRKKEKEEKEKKREQAKSEFIALLREKNVDRHARWVDAKKKIDSDARYKAVESSTLKEDYFREYCKLIKDEKKKDSKEKDRESRSASKKEKKDKERDERRDKDKRERREKQKAGDVSGTTPSCTQNPKDGS